MIPSKFSIITEFAGATVADNPLSGKNNYCSLVLTAKWRASRVKQGGSQSRNSECPQYPLWWRGTDGK